MVWRGVQAEHAEHHNQELHMQFEEIDAGDFRIYAGALERLRTSAYSAAVVVVRLRADGCIEEVFRDEDIGAGYPWPTAKEALHYAVQRGRDVVMCRTGMSRPASLPRRVAA
jgi:hypothetical protein